MWAIHWDSFPRNTKSDFLQFKYFQIHKKMHASGFRIKEIEESLRTTLDQVGLGNIIHQSIVGPVDEWCGCKASVIATVSRL